jgi:Tol biopolymer transport system component
VLELSSGAVRPLTFEDGAEGLDSWSADGQWVFYSSSSRDIAGMNDIYKVPLAGGTPVPVSAEQRRIGLYFLLPLGIPGDRWCDALDCGAAR